MKRQDEMPNLPLMVHVTIEGLPLLDKISHTFYSTTQGIMARADLRDASGKISGAVLACSVEGEKGYKSVERVAETLRRSLSENGERLFEYSRGLQEALDLFHLYQPHLPLEDGNWARFTDRTGLRFS